ncbi:MAG TPA: hypothetical protein VLX91_03120 [Candidatus Acidoferrales bacterium]|nr:hypothetical protein [Candidatus Acidoferrales bacterium]
MALSAVGFASYWVGLHGAYYADDFKLVFPNPSSKIFYFFSHPNPNSSFYRPLEWMVVSIVQWLAGMNTFPIHLIILICHIALSYLVFIAAFRLTESQPVAWLSSGYMLLSQANAMAVLGNDMLSQVCGTLFGFISIWYFYRVCIFIDEPHRQGRLYLFSLFCFTISLWFKETSVGFALALTLMPFMANAKRWSRNFLRSVYHLSPFYIVTAAYVMVHFSVVTRQAADRYEFHFGLNVLKNLCLSILSAFLPTSSVATFVAYSQHHFFSLSLIVIAALVVFSLFLVGLIRAGLTTPVKILIAVSLASLFPMLLFKHMGELYVYNSMPALAILFGLGIENFYQRYLKRRSAKIGGALLVGLLFLSHGDADFEKGRMGVIDGQRAAELINEIQPFIDKVSYDGTLVLLNPTAHGPRYSIFLMDGFNVLIYGTNILNQVSNRYDMHVWIMDEGSRESQSLPSDALVLTLTKNHVQMLNR